MHVEVTAGADEASVACDKERCCFSPPLFFLTPQHQGLVPNFVAISQIKDKQKNAAASRPSSDSKR